MAGGAWPTLAGGRGAWPGQGQCGQEACGRPPHPVSSLLAPLPGRLWLRAARVCPAFRLPPRPAFQRWGHGGFCLFFYLFRVRVSVGGRAPALVHVRRSEDNLWEFVFSFHHVGSSNRTQIECPGSPSWLPPVQQGYEKVKTAVTSVETFTHFKFPPQKPQRQKKGV